MKPPKLKIRIELCCTSPAVKKSFRTLVIQLLNNIPVKNIRINKVE
jgi:hypothetical protein